MNFEKDMVGQDQFTRKSEIYRMENIDNTQEDSDDSENYEFEFNFINMPWGDRTKESKVGILLLLGSIFAVTMAGVFNSFHMHYRGFKLVSSYYNENGSNCQISKLDAYPFVAKIRSVNSKELLCVGALVSENSVLANGACVRSGPIRLDLGNINEPRCKNGFSVDVIVPMYHDGVISKNLVLLTSQSKLSVCGQVIPIRFQKDWEQRADVIGRAFQVRTISRQPVSLAGKDCVCTGMASKLKNSNDAESIICVKKKLSHCPVLVGDLLVQHNRLLGLASTSAYRSTEDQTYCFADLNAISKHLKELAVVS